MSYCRFSSDNYRCDLYCYASDRGFVTHVAGTRFVGDIPEVPPILSVPSDVWMEAHKAQRDFISTAERKRIGLPCDGANYTDDDLESFLVTVKGLLAMGYRGRPGLVEDIEDELKQLTPKP